MVKKYKSKNSKFMLLILCFSTFSGDPTIKNKNNIKIKIYLIKFCFLCTLNSSDYFIF